MMNTNTFKAQVKTFCEQPYLTDDVKREGIMCLTLDFIKDCEVGDKLDPATQGFVMCVKSLISSGTTPANICEKKALIIAAMSISFAAVHDGNQAKTADMTGVAFGITEQEGSSDNEETVSSDEEENTKMGTASFHRESTFKSYFDKNEKILHLKVNKNAPKVNTQIKTDRTEGKPTQETQKALKVAINSQKNTKSDPNTKHENKIEYKQDQQMSDNHPSSDYAGENRSNTSILKVESDLDSDHQQEEEIPEAKVDILRNETSEEPNDEFYEPEEFRQMINSEKYNRWLAVSEIVHLLTPREDMYLPISKFSPSSPPPSGSLFLYDRTSTRNYKRDGYSWIRKSKTNKVREDHVKLRLNGVYRVAGSYVHSSTKATMHRRAYHLIDEGGSKNVKEQVKSGQQSLVLVHYLDTEEAGQSSGTSLIGAVFKQKKLPPSPISGPVVRAESKEETPQVQETPTEKNEHQLVSQNKPIKDSNMQGEKKRRKIWPHHYADIPTFAVPPVSLFRSPGLITSHQFNPMNAEPLDQAMLRIAYARGWNHNSFFPPQRFATFTRQANPEDSSDVSGKYSPRGSNK